jgi:RNA polymerase sigma-70 factor (ECF subfamily)
MLSSPDHSFVVPSISADMRQLFDAHFAFVWRYMAHRGVPVAQIDDLAQNVFRIVREHPSRHDPQRSRTVLAGMVSRQVLREWRKRNPPQQSDEGDGPTMAFSRHAAGQVLDAVLEGMTETQREVLLMSQGENMSNKDIGDTLGVPESVVASRLESAAKLMTTLVAKLRMHPIWDTLPSKSRDARSLMDAAQRARTPTDGDRERVWAGMLAVSMTGGPGLKTEVVMPAMPMTVPTAEPVSIPHLSKLETQELMPAKDRRPLVWGAVAFAAMAMGIIGYGLNSWIYANSNTEQMTGTAQAALVAEPAQAAPAPAAAEPKPTVEAAKEPAVAPEVVIPVPDRVQDAAPARRRTKSAAPARTPHRYNSANEARQLFAAERALKAGESKLALDMIIDLERQYPQSKYEAERASLKAQVLCSRGRTQAARKMMLELEANNADAPLLAAVDQACQ